MQNKAKNIIALIITGVLLSACKQEIDSSLIRLFCNENMAQKQKVIRMKAFQHKILSGLENKQSEKITLIDPNKKPNNDKESVSKLTISGLQEKIGKTMDEYEKNYTSLADITESNKIFIAAIPGSEQSGATVKLNWHKNMMICNGIAEKNTDLEKEIINLYQQYNELTEQTIKDLW